MGAPYGSRFYLELSQKISLDHFSNELIRALQGLYHLQGYQFAYEMDWPAVASTKVQSSLDNVLVIRTADSASLLCLFVEVYLIQHADLACVQYCKILDWNSEAHSFLVEKNQKVTTALSTHFRNMRLLYGRGLADFSMPEAAFSALDRTKDFRQIGADIYIDHRKEKY